jgi:hydroxymethylpyrimidine kinase/phosphomethylpyrimidine kinase
MLSCDDEFWFDADVKRLPIALTIAGSDSGGGAGIQADLKTFAALGVHGTSVIACLTAQNPKRVLAAYGVHPEFVLEQLDAVFSELPPAAIKTGMLYSEQMFALVLNFLRRLPDAKRPPLVVDPVMMSTSGAPLMEKWSLNVFHRLFRAATIITPNLDEATALVGRKLKSAEDARQAARDLRAKFGCAVLVKGGHLRGPEAIDFFFDGKSELMLSAPRVTGVATHGTGCTYAAAIAAGLAKGMKLEKAVVAAKEFVTRAIAGSVRIGKHQALGWF